MPGSHRRCGLTGFQPPSRCDPFPSRGASREALQQPPSRRSGHATQPPGPAQEGLRFPRRTRSGLSRGGRALSFYGCCFCKRSLQEQSFPRSFCSFSATCKGGSFPAARSNAGRSFHTSATLQTPMSLHKAPRQHSSHPRLPIASPVRSFPPPLWQRAAALDRGASLTTGNAVTTDTVLFFLFF